MPGSKNGGWILSDKDNGVYTYPYSPFFLMTSLLQPFLPLLGATIITIPIGFFWFSKWMFAKPWSQMSGVTEEMMKKGPNPLAFGVSILSGFLYAIVLRMILAVGTPVSVTLFVGVLLWFVFNFIPQLVHHMFDKRPYKLLFINEGFQLVNVIAICLIIGYWG